MLKIPRPWQTPRMSLFRKKPLAQVVAEAGDPNFRERGHDAVAGGLKRTLGRNRE